MDPTEQIHETLRDRGDRCVLLPTTPLTITRMPQRVRLIDELPQCIGPSRRLPSLIDIEP